MSPVSLTMVLSEDKGASKASQGSTRSHPANSCEVRFEQVSNTRQDVGDELNVIERVSNNLSLTRTMDLAASVFDARHTDNTEVLLALLTQNKELEGTK